MIFLVFVAVALAIALVAIDIGSELGGSRYREANAGLKIMVDSLQKNNAALGGEVNHLRNDHAAIQKQLDAAQEKEGDFITKIFDQRKELDAKAEEIQGLIAANKNLQDKVGEYEKYLEIMRKQQEKIVVEFKKLKAEKEILEAELQSLTGKDAARRKKTVSALHN